MQNMGKTRQKRPKNGIFVHQLCVTQVLCVTYYTTHSTYVTHNYPALLQFFYHLPYFLAF